MTSSARLADPGIRHAAFWLLVAVAAAGPVVIHAIVPGTGGWLGLALTVVAFGVAFLVAPVRAVAAVAAYMVFIESIAGVAGDRMRSVDELMIPTMVLLSLVTPHRPVRSWFRPGRDGAVAVLVLAAIFSSIVNGVALTTWLPQLLLLVKGLAVFYIVLAHEVSGEDVRWILRIYLALGLVVLGTGAIQLAAGFVAGTGTGAARGGIPVVTSVFYHPELFGWLCSITALYLIAHHVVFRRPWMLVLALLFSLGTIAAARRKSILATVAGLATGAATELIRGSGRLRRLGGWLPSAVGVAVLLLAFLPVLSGLYDLTIEGYVDPVVTGPAIEEPTGSPQDSSSGQGVASASPVTSASTPARVALYLGAVAIASDEFPFGAGLGRYGSWISRVDYSDVYHRYGLDRIYGLSPTNPQFITDTYWPQILGEAGIIGLIGYAAFIGWIAVELVRLIRRDLAPVQRAVVLGSGMLLAATLIESVASPILGSPSQAYVVMLAFAGTFSWVGSGARRAADRAAPGMPETGGTA